MRVGPYAIYCLVLAGALLVMEVRGVNLLPESHHVSVPSSVRGAPGGYRTYRFWGGGGFRGGK
ncbi:MAG: hypothetical protein ACLQDQ_02935 [Myxococcaceae bacterium]